MSKKDKFKIASILTIAFVMMTLISLKGLITNADVSDRPEFDIEFDSISESARVGEDIVITGILKPKPFEVDIKNKDTEIIIVMDRNTTKKGMGEVINSLRNGIADSIRGLSLTGNIKLGLIDYTTDANIFKFNNNAMININDRYQIANIIDNFSVDELAYSNTGEALRKAAYLMESSESYAIKNKIILLFSDGPPTARTVYSNGEAYTDITQEGYGDAQIQTSKNDYTKGIEYAKTIGSKIKENGYTVYTIGYNIGNEYEESVLREIHQSMAGDTLDKRFYILPAKKVTEEVNRIFNVVKEDILNTYPVNNIKMNINLTGDFSLGSGENTVNLNNINYKLVSQSNGKARYEADPIPFEFILKGKTEGERQQIFDKVTISYPWQGSIEKADINSQLFITITSNELPNILAKLTSDEVVNVSKGDEFTVKYELYPEDFQFKDSSNSLVKDVVLVVDNSKNMDQNALNGTMNSIMNTLVDDATLKNNNTQYSIITLAKDNKISLELTSDRSIIQPITSKIQSGGPQWNSEADLGSAFYEINNIIQKGRKEASKNIIIVAQENVNYTDTELSYFKEIVKNNGYNVIVLIVGQQNWNNDLNKMSKLVGENGLNIGLDNLFKSGSDHNSIANSIMSKVRDRIINSTVYRPYVFNPQITVDLLENFEARSGLEIIDRNIAKITSNEQIIYNHIGDNNYHAEPIYVEFTVKVKENNQTQLNFGNILLTHKSLYGNDKKILLKSPKVIVKSEVNNISHGLYNGINNGQISIQEKNNNENSFEIAQGSTVTFGATFTLSGSSTEFNLNVDSNFNTLNTSNIKIYKVLKDSSGKSTLEKLDSNKTISTSENNKFKISINNMTDSSTEILVVYQGKIKYETSSEQKLTNYIVFASTSESVTIVTPSKLNNSPILPDLF